jgi:DNA-directed RNA polymerase subunit RPC12/RpoP
MHDTDLGIFKVVSGGTNLFSFKAQDVVNWNKGTAGVVRKKLVTSISVKFQNSDEYVFEFESKNDGSYQRTKQAISGAIQTDLAFSEILRILKLNERVPIEDVCKILTRFNMPNSFEDGKNVVEFFISSDKAQGTFDGRGFVSKLALERESVRYEIVAKFEMNSSGNFVLKCPGCGASLPLDKKESTGKCTYCGSSYVVPKKLLDLI